MADADSLLYRANVNSLLVLERDAFVRVARQLRQVLHESQHQLGGEFHRAHMGHETIRQVRDNTFTTHRKIFRALIVKPMELFTVVYI